MTPEFKNQLNRLAQANKYTISDVYDAIQRLKIEWTEADRDIVWMYYYPTAINKAYHFLAKDEEHATQAAFEFLARWIDENRSCLQFSGEVVQLSKFFDVSAENSFKNYLRLTISPQPDIVYGHEQEDYEEDDYGDGDDLTHIRTPNTTFEWHEDYPYEGTNTDDPETIQIKKEEFADAWKRADAIRAELYDADRDVLDLLLQDYNSEEIEAALKRSMSAVRQSVYRIRQVVDTLNRG